MNESSSTADFVNSLLEKNSGLQYVYDEHVMDNGELLPHVFLGDIARYVVLKVRSGTISQHVIRILEFLELGIGSGNMDVEELVHVSFVENIFEYEDVIIKLKEAGLIDTNLENALKSFRKWSNFGTHSTNQ